MSSRAPVVLVHGLTASTDWWRPTIAALEPRHEVRIVELAGLTVEAASRRLAAFLEDENLGGASLVGHSMGGTIALLTAAEVPEAVGRLAVIAPAGIFSSRSRRSYIRPLVRSTVIHAPRQLPRMLRDVVRIGPWRLWRLSSDLLRCEIEPALERIAAPTLILWGGEDRLLPATLGEVFLDGIPTSRMVVMPNCGHVPMLECPDALHGHLLGFLA